MSCISIYALAFELGVPGSVLFLDGTATWKMDETNIPYRELLLVFVIAGQAMGHGWRSIAF